MRKKYLAAALCIPAFFFCMQVAGAAEVQLDSVTGTNSKLSAPTSVFVNVRTVSSPLSVQKNFGIGTDDTRLLAPMASPGDPLPVGTRVRAAVDHPHASDCLLKGATGTIFCYDPVDPKLPYLVNWDDYCEVTMINPQCQICNNCAPNGWWVAANEIELLFPHDLAVNMSGVPGSVEFGQQVTYTVNVTNFGEATATGVVLTDALKHGIKYVSASPGQGTCATAENTITCTIGNLAKGASCAITIVAETESCGRLTNKVFVAGDELDENISNNSAKVETMVACPPNLAPNYLLFDSNKK